MSDFNVVLPGDKVPLPSPHVGPGLCVLEEDCSSAVVSIAGILKGAGPEEESGRKTTTWIAKRVSMLRE